MSDTTVKQAQRLLASGLPGYGMYAIVQQTQLRGFKPSLFTLTLEGYREQPWVMMVAGFELQAEDMILTAFVVDTEASGPFKQENLLYSLLITDFHVAGERDPEMKIRERTAKAWAACKDRLHWLRDVVNAPNLQEGQLPEKVAAALQRALGEEVHRAHGAKPGVVESRTTSTEVLENELEPNAASQKAVADFRGLLEGN